MSREPTTSKYIDVQESEIHGTGVFARTDIPKGKKVIEYIGEKITKKESEKRSIALIEKNQGSLTDGAVYVFELNKRYDLDGNVPEIQPASSITPAIPTANLMSSKIASGCSPREKSKRARS